MRKAGVAGLVWDQATLDKFLENPMRFLPGTRMGTPASRTPKSARERADLIAFLKAASAGSKRR